MEHLNYYLKANKLKNTELKKGIAPVIRKLENGGWYWINNKILKTYAKVIGASGIAVYNVLASFANAKTQTCFPAHKTISNIAGVSKRTVSQKILQMESLGLIHREKQKRGSVCYLLDMRQATKLISIGEKNDP